MKRFLESFRRATGCGASVLDASGRPVLIHSEPRAANLCRRIISSGHGPARCCIRDRRRSSEQAFSLGEPYIFSCHAGLILFSVPLLEGQKLLGCVVSEPMLMRTPTASDARETALRLDGHDRDSDEIMHLLSKIPVRPEREVQALADLLFTVVNFLVGTQAMVLRQRAEISRQQAQISEILQKWKKRDLSQNKAPGVPANLERELIERVKMGDRKAARVMLDDLLGHILVTESGENELTKARTLELVVILSRAAVEAGANLEEILGLKYRYIQNLSRMEAPENLYRWIIDIFDQLMDCIYRNRGISHNQLFIEVKEHIWKNYHRKLTLSEIAAKVGLSPYYLSHLFRKELGITFVEYLNSVRVMISKDLIEKNEGNLLQVALTVGFSDSSYFCKVFRRLEGISPSQYRNMCRRHWQKDPGKASSAALSVL